MAADRRLLRVYFDHAQKRLKRGRIGFTARGFDFLEGLLVGAWVSPVTGVLQPIPNSEEADFQTSNSGRFAKLNLSDVTTADLNGNSGGFSMMAVDHLDQAIRYTYENTSGIGVKTIDEYPENTGWTALAYAYGKGTDQDGILIELGWSNTLNGETGVSIRVYQDGRLEVWKDGTMRGRGSFSGGGYQPGTVRGASYERATDEYVMIRVEATRKRYLTITSSKGGVFQFACPWAIAETPEPVLPESQFWWYIPKGGGAVIAAPVVYGYSSPYAVSPVYKLAEIPGSGELFTARTISVGQGTVTLVKPDGVTAYVPTSSECRIKVAVTGFVDGVTGSFPPIYEDMLEPDDGPIDVSQWILKCDANLEDGPMGFSANLAIQGNAPVPLLTEVEGRAIKLVLDPHPDDDDAPDPITLLDGVGEQPPEFEDGFAPESTVVNLAVRDRLKLVREAQVTETVVFDGMELCQPATGGDSVVRTALREGGLLDSEMDLIDLEYRIEETPPQRAGEWNFAAEVGDLWGDVLDRAFGMAPQIIWGLRPNVDGTEFYTIDPEVGASSVGTLYRRPDDVPTPDETEIGAYYATYGDHTRAKMPREANVVRVTGYDPAADKGLQAYISDDDSRRPSAPQTEGKLGFTRQFAYSDPALNTQEMVDDLCTNVWKAVARKKYGESWKALFQFLDSGRPVWRGDIMTLDQGAPDGSDTMPQVSGFSWSMIDESGEGLADEGGKIAPVTIRPTNYTGGSIVNLGGSTLGDIARRQREEVDNGSLRRRGWRKIPSTSSGEVKALPIP